MNKTNLHKSLRDTLKNITEDLIGYMPKNSIKELNVLYIDDEVRSLNSFRRLSRQVFNLHTAESIEQASQILKSVKIDLILCDYTLQKREEVQTCQELEAAVQDIPIAIVTGAFINEDHELNNYHYEVIPKPFSICDILNSSTFKSILLDHKTHIA